MMKYLYRYRTTTFFIGNLLGWIIADVARIAFGGRVNPASKYVIPALLVLSLLALVMEVLAEKDRKTP